MTMIVVSALLCAIILPVAYYASFCGQSTVPFSLEVLPNGQPVLGCARPSCFGWNREGKPASPPPTFYRIEQRADGYFRRATPDTVPARENGTLSEYYRPQIAVSSHSPELRVKSSKAFSNAPTPRTPHTAPTNSNGLAGSPRWSTPLQGQSPSNAATTPRWSCPRTEALLPFVQGKSCWEEKCSSERMEEENRRGSSHSTT